MDAAQYLAIASAIKAEAGVTEHKTRKSLSGVAYAKEGKIEAPEGKTRKQLYILAHECAHVALHKTGGKSRHVEEMEAEKWAHAALRRHGIAVPKAMTKRAKRHVSHKIHQARRRGALHIDRAALAYADNRDKKWTQ